MNRGRKLKPGGLTLGTKNNQLKIDCPAFADGMALNTSTIENAQIQLLELQKPGSKNRATNRL